MPVDGLEPITPEAESDFFHVPPDVKAVPSLFPLPSRSRSHREMLSRELTDTINRDHAMAAHHLQHAVDTVAKLALLNDGAI